jgi:hypothetical protein
VCWSTSIGWNGGDAGSHRFCGEELKRRNGERKKMEWGKKGQVTPLPYLYPRAEVVGTVVVFHYPDSYCAWLPRVGTTWGGGSNYRATRHVMTVMAAVINDKQ